MVCLVQLTRLQEALDYDEERAELRELYKELANQMNAINAVCPVKREVDVYFGSLVLQFNYRDFRMLDRLNRGTNACFHQLACQPIYHADFTNGWVINE